MRLSSGDVVIVGQEGESAAVGRARPSREASGDPELLRPHMVVRIRFERLGRAVPGTPVKTLGGRGAEVPQRL